MDWNQRVEQTRSAILRIADLVVEAFLFSEFRAFRPLPRPSSEVVIAEGVRWPGPSGPWSLYVRGGAARLDRYSAWSLAIELAGSGQAVERLEEVRQWWAAALQEMRDHVSRIVQAQAAEMEELRGLAAMASLAGVCSAPPPAWLADEAGTTMLLALAGSIASLWEPARLLHEAGAKASPMAIAPGWRWPWKGDWWKVGPVSSSDGAHSHHLEDDALPYSIGISCRWEPRRVLQAVRQVRRAQEIALLILDLPEPGGQ